MKINNNKGFTLIELLIVVAIIAILAAIAIPQFSAYRIKGYNASALSDLRNGVTAQAAMWADVQAYGNTDGVATLLTAPVPAAGAINVGPMPPAVGGAAPVAGGRYAGVNDQLLQGTVASGFGNGINLRAQCSLTALGGYNSYIIAAKNAQGDTVYVADSDNSASMYRVSNPAWVNSLSPGFAAALIPVPLNGTDDVNGFAGGGAPTVNFTSM